MTSAAYQPSTISRRLSVVVGCYRVCVIDKILAHLPADYVRRRRPAEPPTPRVGPSAVRGPAARGPTVASGKNSMVTLLASSAADLRARTPPVVDTKLGGSTYL